LNLQGVNGKNVFTRRSSRSEIQRCFGSRAGFIALGGGGGGGVGTIDWQVIAEKNVGGEGGGRAPPQSDWFRATSEKENFAKIKRKELSGKSHARGPRSGEGKHREERRGGQVKPEGVCGYVERMFKNNCSSLE